MFGRPLRSRRLYYGWWMVAVGVLINIIGSVNGAISSVFFLPLTHHLQVGHGALALALALARLESGVVGPLAGWLLDRRGPRVTITIGCLMCGFGLILLPFVQSYLTFLLLYMVVISSSVTAGFHQSMHQVANLWFSRQRTKVLGIFSFAIRLGRAIFIPVLALAAARWGWQAASFGAGVFVLVTVLPLSALVRRSPDEVGERPDGDPEEPRPAAGSPVRSPTATPALTFAEGIRTRAYWIIVFSTFVRTALGGAVQGQLIPIVVSKGMSEAAGAWLLGLWALLASGMLLVIGYAADRFSKRVLLSTGHAATAVGMLLLVVAGGDWAPLLGVVILLSFAESMAPANLSIVGDLFGRAAFGRLSGMITTFTTIGVICAPALGYSYDRYANYDRPLLAFAVLGGLGLVAVWGFLRPPALARASAIADVADEPAAR